MVSGNQDNKNSLINTCQDFDWRAFVAQTKPSLTGSKDQHQRREVLDKLVVELGDWAAKYKLPTKRVSPSAYTGVYATPSPIYYPLVLVMAKYTLWLFVLDGYIDKLNYEQLNTNQVNIKLGYLDDYLNLITRAFYEVGGLTSKEGEILGLAPRETLKTEILEVSTPKKRLVESEKDGLNLSLSEALFDIYSSLERLWKNSDNQKWEDNFAFKLTNFTCETALVVGAMRGELSQSFIYQQTLDRESIPTLEQYLERSKFSICLRAAGSVAVGFENFPQQIWEQWIPAMEPGAKALRLANDLANVWSELEERKINAMTIVLNQLGFAPMEPYQKDSLEIVQARALVRSHMETEIAHFSQQAVRLPQGVLSYYVYASVAFTIAMYEKGDYVELT